MPKHNLVVFILIVCIVNHATNGKRQRKRPVANVYDEINTNEDVKETKIHKVKLEHDINNGKEDSIKDNLREVLWHFDSEVSEKHERDRTTQDSTAFEEIKNYEEEEQQSPWKFELDIPALGRTFSNIAKHIKVRSRPIEKNSNLKFSLSIPEWTANIIKGIEQAIQRRYTSEHGDRFYYVELGPGTYKTAEVQHRPDELKRQLKKLLALKQAKLQKQGNLN